MRKPLEELGDAARPTSLPPPPPSEEMSESVPSRSWLSGRGAACMSVMGCGRGTEAPGQTVNNYRDVGASERGAALTAVTHTWGTVRRRRTVRSGFETLLLTINYGLSYESTDKDGTDALKWRAN